MNPFEQWGAQLEAAGQRRRRVAIAGDVETEPGQLRALLVDGPKSTKELEEATGLTDKQIWGRLKWDMQQGRVVRTNDKFELCDVEVDTLAINDAIKLLRRHGYTVGKKKKAKAPHE